MVFKMTFNFFKKKGFSIKQILFIPKRKKSNCYKLLLICVTKKMFLKHLHKKTPPATASLTLVVLHTCREQFRGGPVKILTVDTSDTHINVKTARWSIIFKDYCHTVSTERVVLSVKKHFWQNSKLLRLN